jgi:hypothetical protein
MSLDKSRRRLPAIIRASLFVISGLLLAGVLFLMLIPRLDGPHSRQHAHQAVAVSKLLTIIDLQKKYAAAHPEKGFACELPQLKPLEQQEKNSDYDPFGFLSTGTWAGYRFEIEGCHVEKKGIVAHYQASAVPVVPGTTGFRAFCTDETGTLRYDDSGVREKCLASGHVLE